MTSEKWRTQMRRQKRSLWVAAIICLGAIAPSAQALDVTFCIPSCSAGATIVTAGPGTPQLDLNTGVITTQVTVPSFVMGSGGANRFTINATVTAEQSGTLQKITFNPTTISTSTASGCNTTTNNPCRLQIVATSSLGDLVTTRPADFPNPKST